LLRRAVVGGLGTGSGVIVLSTPTDASVQMRSVLLFDGTGSPVIVGEL